MTPPLKAEDIDKLAVGEKELSKFEQIRVRSQSSQPYNG
jgi:hypothetical protein